MIFTINKNLFRVSDGWIITESQENAKKGSVCFEKETGNIFICKENHHEEDFFVSVKNEIFHTNQDPFQVYKILASTFILSKVPIFKLPETEDYYESLSVYREFPSNPKGKDWQYNRDVHSIKKQKAFIKGANFSKKKYFLTESDLLHALQLKEQNIPNQEIIKYFTEDVKNRKIYQIELQHEWKNERGEVANSFSEIALFDEKTHQFDAFLIPKLFDCSFHSSGEYKIENIIYSKKDDTSKNKK